MKSELRREQILDCAKKVFARNGYHKTNIAMICQKAGIGRGTLYQYFRNKDAVFSAILENIFDNMLSEMAKGISSDGGSYASEEDLLSAHARTLELGCMVWLADRDFARIAFEMSLGVSKEFTDMRQRFDRKNIALIRQRLEQWKENGLIREDLDPELAAIKMHGGMEKIVTIYLIDRKKKLSEKEVKELVLKIAELNIYGMRNMGQA